MAPQPPSEKMALRNKKVVTLKELIPVSREEQREAREKADQVKANKKTAAAHKKATEQKKKTARIAALEDQLAKEDQEMQNVSVADMLSASEKIIPVKATASRTRKAAATDSSAVVADSSSAAVVESISAAVVDRVSVQALLEDDSEARKATKQGTASKGPVSDGDSSGEEGNDTPPAPIHKLTPKRFPQSPKSSRTLHRSPSPLAQPDFGLIPELESEENLASGMDEGESDGEMKDGAHHDAVLRNDPEAEDSEGLFFGNMGMYEREDKEEDDVGKAARHQGTKVFYGGQEAEDVSDGDGDYRGSASPSADDDRMLVDSEEEGEDEDEAEIARQIAKMQATLRLKKKAKAKGKGKESQTAVTKRKEMSAAKLQVPKVKPDKAAIRKEITGSRALPPPPRPSMAVVPTARAKTGSKRKETDDNEMDNAKRPRTSDVGGMNANWQSLLLPAKEGSTKGKKKASKRADTSTTADAPIVLKDVDVDLAIQGKITKAKKTYNLSDLPFDNHAVDARRFKESFIPALYDWSGSLDVEYPFATTGHANLKAVVVDLWTNIVFKYLSPLDVNEKSRVENDAVMNVAMQSLRTLRSEIAKNARAGMEDYCKTQFSTQEEIISWIEYQLTDDNFLYLDPEASGPEAGAFLSPTVLRVFGYYLQGVQNPPKSYGVPAAGLALCAAAAMYSLTLFKTGKRQTADEDNGSKNNSNSFRDDPWGTIAAGFFAQIKEKFTLDTWRKVVTAAKPYITKKKGQPIASSSKIGEGLLTVRPTLRM